MKPYGNSRRDNLVCKYECCHGKFLLGYNCHRKIRNNGDYAVIRRSRKRERKMLKNFAVYKPFLLG